MAKEAKAKKAKATSTGSDNVTSRITFGSTSDKAVPTAPKVSKEDAAQQFAEGVLKAGESVTANIKKTTKGRCLVVEFGGLPQEGLSVTAFVFGGDHIVIGGEVVGNESTSLYNQFKRTYDSVEGAAKFMRLAFLKNKEDAALQVPIKPPRGGAAGGHDADTSA